MTGISGFADSLDRATPGDFAMFDLTFNMVPALPAELGSIPVSPDDATLGDADLGELLTGLESTVDDLAGPAGLLPQLLGGLTGGDG